MYAKAYAKIIVSMLIWGTLGIFVKMTDVPSVEIVLFRVIFGGIFLLLVYLFGKHRSNAAAVRRAVPILIASGICMGVNWLFLFEAYKYTTVSIATVAYYCSPVIVTVFSPLLFREKIASSRVLGIAVCLIGLVMITGTLTADKSTLKGFGLGLLSAVFYAAVTSLNKFVKGISGIEITLIQLFGAFIVMLPYCLITQKTIIMPSAAKGLIALVILGVVHSGIALWLYFSSLQTLSAQSAALCSFIDPGSALVFSALILNEKMTVVQIVAAVLILGGALFGEITAPKGSSNARRRKRHG